MKPGFYITFLIVNALNLLIGLDISAQAWDFIKERDGIKIYTRSEENSPLKSFKGEVYLKTDMDKISKVIGKIESFDWWDDNIRDIKVLDYVEEKHIRYYLVYDVQWPFSDRDLCVEALITNDPVTGKRVVRATPLLNVVPESPDNVRIVNYWQQWTMEPEENGMIHLTLEGAVDPAGNIPSWLINLVITDTPLNIMKQVREQVEIN